MERLKRAGEVPICVQIAVQITHIPLCTQTVTEKLPENAASGVLNESYGVKRFKTLSDMWLHRFISLRYGS